MSFTVYGTRAKYAEARLRLANCAVDQVVAKSLLMQHYPLKRARSPDMFERANYVDMYEHKVKWTLIEVSILYECEEVGAG